MARRKKKISLEEAEEFLMETDPIILATDPKMKGKVKLGTKVMVVLPKFSRRLKEVQKKQLEAGEIKKFGELRLEDGKVLEINKSYIVPLTFEIKTWLKEGVLMGGSKVR